MAFTEEDLTKLMKLVERNIKSLLSLEKRRRNIPRNRLLFIGMADLAEYYWCSMKSLFSNREMELGYFGAYLEDRIRYSFELGLLDTIPQNFEDILKIGEEITFKDVEKLLEMREKEKGFRMPLQHSIVFIIDHGETKLLIDPDLSPNERKKYESMAKTHGMPILTLEDLPPKRRGEVLHRMKAESYPNIRWNFSWDRYVVVGLPDGITKDFVYEFKTTRKRFLVKYLKPVAFTQADLYGYFFRRKRKRVQMYVMEEKRHITWDEEVDIENAISTLEKFKSLEDGMKPKPPRRWKCKSCEFKEICPIYNENYF